MAGDAKDLTASPSRVAAALYGTVEGAAAPLVAGSRAADRPSTEGLSASEPSAEGAPSCCPAKRSPRSSLPLRGVLTIVGGFLVHFIIGVLYTWGNMSPYVVSYMREIAGRTDCESRHFTWVLSFIFSAQAVTMVAAGLLMPYLGPRWMTLMGAAIMAIGTMVSSFLLHSYVAFIFSYSILFGFGVGFCYGPPISCALRWFPHNKALASGLVVAGVGSSAVVFTQLQTAWINPANVAMVATGAGAPYFTDRAMLERVPSTIFYSSFIYFAVTGVAAMLLSFPPEDPGRQRGATGTAAGRCCGRPPAGPPITRPFRLWRLRTAGI